jgi:(p)ppGpp synthase/HD superfamily hydrolase
MSLEAKALEYAVRMHGKQTRKYTGEPYIFHPIEVASIIRTVPHTSEMVAAAYLHDVVEDTDATIVDVERRFGSEVGRLVWYLTDISRPGDGNRAKRKAMDREHLAGAPPEAQTIKLADLISNTSSIRAYDPDFWIVYRREKRALLQVMLSGDRGLYDRAMRLCEE